MPLVSIIIPAYNEENRISKTLQAYLDYFQKNYGDDFEILVVLNGCKDKTEEIVASYSRLNPNLQYKNIPEPIGKGGAIVEGFKLSKGEMVAFSDADGSTRPEILDRLFRITYLIPTIDCVVGSRNLPGSVVTGKTKTRNIMSVGFNWGVNFLFNLKIKDTQCGAKVIKQRILQKIVNHITISNMAFDVNLLVDIKRAKGNMLEVPIEWEDDNDSSIKTPIKTSVVMALSVIRLYIIYSPFIYLNFIFEPIGTMLWLILLTPKEREYRKIKH